MAVAEILRGIGSWSLALNPNTPQEIIKKIDDNYFGHIAISSGRVDPRTAGDALLDSARYVGVFRGKGRPSTAYNMRGAGMAFWLGDEEGKGDVIENTIALSAASFATGINALLPTTGSVVAGTIYPVPGQFSGSFRFVGRREALEYFVDTMGAEFRVNNDATLDAGLESDLYRMEPIAAIVRNTSGRDMQLRLLSGDIQTEQDMEDFTTRVLLIASGSGTAVTTGSADIDPVKNPFKDLRGNTLKLVRMVGESVTGSTNANARAQLQLNRFSAPRDAITLSTEDYDVIGDAAVGDYIWVFDPDAGAYDESNQIWFQGRQLYPVKLRLTGATWPITAGMGVAFRTRNGEWIDLADYFVPEDGGTTLEVGGYRRSLVGGTPGPGGDRATPDNSIPGVPTWNQPFLQSTYQSTETGETQAQAELSWNRPNNTDGTVIADGAYYQIRYRVSGSPNQSVTWDDISLFTWDEIAASGGTWDNPFQYQPGEWQYITVPFDNQKAMLVGLSPTINYEAQIRAVDTANPPNVGGWSDTASWQTLNDTIAPATPAPPFIAANPLSIQMTHFLGRSDGGDFNLDRDLAYLEVHGEYEPAFTPSAATLIGKIPADQGMLIAQTPVVASFNVSRIPPQYYKVVAVDRAGNKSLASDPVESQAELISDEYITNLTVSKVTAGTISANWLLGATIRTGTVGARCEMSFQGFGAWNTAGTKTFDVSASTGNVSIIGSLKSGTASTRIEINPSLSNPTIDMYPNSAGGRIRLQAYDNNNPDGTAGAGMRLQSEVAATSARNGGFLTFTENGAFFGSDYGVAATYGYYWIDSDGKHSLRGRWRTVFDPYSALVMGQSATFNKAVVGGTVAYAITMITAMNPVINAYQFDAGTPLGSLSGAASLSNTSNNTVGFAFRMLHDVEHSPPEDNRTNYAIRYWGFRV